MLTARKLIEAARDRHQAFTPLRHPDRVLVRQLSGEQRRLVGKVAQTNPTAIAALLQVGLDAYDFAEGAELPPQHRIHGATAFARGGGALPLCRTAWENRYDIIPSMLSYYLNGGRLHLRGRPEQWKEIERVEVSYLPIPPELAAMDAEIALPDSAESCLTAFLADHMGAKGHTEAGVPPIDMTLLRSERAEAEADFLREIRSQFTARVFRVRAVR